MKKFNGIEPDVQGIYYLVEDVDMLILQMRNSFSEILGNTHSHHEALNVCRRELVISGKIWKE